jgi:hypothetical protein
VKGVFKMRGSLVALALVVLTVGCGMQDTNAPVPQPDSLILGRISAIRDAVGEPGVREVEIREGLPDQMEAAMRREGRFVPSLDKDVTVRVRVTGDTVCVAGLRAGDLDDFRVGQEVAVTPLQGTTAMTGSKLITADAAEFYLFSAYRLRFLPRSLESVPDEVTVPSDPMRINSAGLETTPLPAQGGSVVYFAAGLLPGIPVGGKEASPVGAVRPGMRSRSGTLAPWAVGGCRPYRAAWARDGWEAPRPVELPDLAADTRARVTWINDDETACLVEATLADGTKQLLAGRRASAKAPWGKLEKLDVPGGPSVGDGQRFGRQLKALVWTAYDANGSDLWLSTEGKPGQMLEPRINTMGSEWAPRVGPNDSLYFCRADRQLLFAGGVVQEVRLPGVQRRPLLEAVPAREGAVLFFQVPRYTPGVLDWDVAVATRTGSNWGKPVPLDEWKPE